MKVKAVEGQLDLLQGFEQGKKTSWEVRVRISTGRRLQKNASAPITQERSQLYASQYLSGLTCTEIARVHGYRSNNTVRQALRKIGFERYRQAAPRRKEAFERRLKQQIRLYESGLTVVQVARRMGLKAATVYWSMKRNGYQFRTIAESKLLSIEERDKRFCTAYQMGLSAQSVASRFNVSTATVLRSLKRRGIKARTSGQYRFNRSKAKAKKYWRAYESGMSLPQIAKFYGVTPSGVAVLLKNHGYQLRTFKEAARIKNRGLHIMPVKDKAPAFVFEL